MRQWLILLLRCLVLLFLVLGFARPTFKFGNILKGDSHVSAVLILDTSLSMQRESVWRQAIQKSRELFQLFKPQDELRILGTEQDYTLTSFHPETSESRLKRIEPGWCYETMETLLQKGMAGLAPSENMNREIYIISDFQKSGYPAVAESNLSLKEISGLYLIPCKGESRNLSITDCGIENQIMDPERPIRIFAHIQNYGNSQASDVLLRLFIDGTPIAQKLISIKAGASERVILNAVPRKTGWITGELRIDDEDFTQDNQSYFSLHLRHQLRILIVGSSQSELLTMQLALQPDRGESKHNLVRTASYDTMWRDHLVDSDVLILINIPEMDRINSAAVHRFIMRRGGIILIPGAKTDIRQLNADLLMQYGEIRLGNVMQALDSAFHVIGKTDFSHPMLEGIFKKGEENIESPYFYRMLTVPEIGNGRSILQYDQGQPLFLSAETESSRLLLLTTGIGPEWSDLAFKPIFAPLMHRAVLFASQSEKNLASIRIGESIHIPLESDWDVMDSYQTELPDGQRYNLVPQPMQNRYSLGFLKTDFPGAYRFYRADSLIRIVTVNVDSRESDFTPIDLEQLKKRWNQKNIQIMKEDTNIERSVLQARWGREIQREMLVIALLLFITELVLSQRGAAMTIPKDNN